MLDRLRRAALAGDNLFAVLMDAVRVCSLGQITNALFEVGGRFRRTMRSRVSLNVRDCGGEDATRGS